MPTLRNLLFLALLTAATQSIGQVNFNFAYQFGSTDSDNPGNALTDSKGNIFMMAEYEDTVDMDPTLYTDLRNPAGEYFFIISKLDKDGQVIFHNEMSDKGVLYGNIIGIIDDKVYFGGSFLDTLRYKHGSTTWEFAGSPGYNGFLMVINNDGEIHRFNHWSVSEEMYFNNVFRLHDGSLMVNAFFADSIYLPELLISDEEGDVLMMKLNEDLDIISTRQIGSTDYDYISDMAYVGGDEIAFTFIYEGDITVQTTEGALFFPGIGEESSFFGSMNLDGDILFAQPIQCSFEHESRAIGIDKEGNYIISGYFEGTINFAHPNDPPVEFTVKNEGDAYIVKYTKDGELLWARVIENEYYGGLYTLELGYQDHIYLTGGFTGVTDLDPGPGSFIQDGGVRGDDYILKLTPGGDFVWAYIFDGNDFTGIRNLTFGSNGRMYVYGYFYGLFNANPIPGDSLKMAPVGGEDAGADVYLTALTEDGIILSTKDEEIEGLTVYPNPANQAITIEAAENFEALRLFDVSGNIISETKANQTKHELQLSSLPAGNYFVEIQSQGRSSVVKFIHAD